MTLLVGWGHSNIYLCGCALAHKGGGVVLGVGTTRKGGLRCGHNPKKGVLGTCTVKKVGSYELVLHKERALGTEVAQKWVLGSLFITYLYVYLYI